MSDDQHREQPHIAWISPTATCWAISVMRFVIPARVIDKLQYVANLVP